MLGLTATLAASGEFKSRGSLETLTLNSRHSHTFFQEAPATGISTLHKLAAKGLLSEYLCAFRVLCNPQQAHPSVAILVEQ